MKRLFLITASVGLVCVGMVAQAATGWIIKDWKPTIRAGSIPTDKETAELPEEKTTTEEHPEEISDVEETPASQTDLEPIETVENEQPDEPEQTENSPAEAE